MTRRTAQQCNCPGTTRNFLCLLPVARSDREKTRGTEVRSTQLVLAAPNKEHCRTNYSCCFAFVLLRAVSSNPPPPPRLLPVARATGKRSRETSRSRRVPVGQVVL